MKKYFKWAILGSITILIVAGLVFIGSRIMAYKIDTKVPEVKKTTEEILAENKVSLEATEVDKSKYNSAEEIYTLLHKMANTLIVAEDGLIYGETPVNEKSVNYAMVIVKDAQTLPNEEKDVLLNVLQSWKEGDFSGAVQDHNYSWKKLGGTIGRAKEIRAEYKK